MKNLHLKPELDKKCSSCYNGCFYTVANFNNGTGLRCEHENIKIWSKNRPKLQPETVLGRSA